MEQRTASKQVGNVPTALISCRIFIGPMRLISSRCLLYLQEFVTFFLFQQVRRDSCRHLPSGTFSIAEIPFSIFEKYLLYLLLFGCPEREELKG